MSRPLISLPAAGQSNCNYCRVSSLFGPVVSCCDVQFLLRSDAPLCKAVQVVHCSSIHLYAAHCRGGHIFDYPTSTSWVMTFVANNQLVWHLHGQSNMLRGIDSLCTFR